MEQSKVQVGYIPRVGGLEPRIRLTIHRKTGSGIVEIRSSAIEDICRPQSESSPDVLAAFRASVPAIMGFLNRIIAETPACGVTVVTRDRIRSQLKAEQHGRQPIFYRLPDVAQGRGSDVQG
jgi:hypothetical protein